MTGLTEPEGHCQPGYYCIQGSSTSSPVSTEHLVLLQAFWHCKSFHKLYPFYFPFSRWGFLLEIFAHRDIIALLAQHTQNRCRALLAPGMDKEEPRMPLGVCLVPLDFSAIRLAKMLLQDFVHKVRQSQTLFSYLETQLILNGRQNLNAFCFKAITAQEGQRLQSQRMVSLEIAVPEDISAPQAQQHLLPAPVENTVMQQVRNWIVAPSVWLGGDRNADDVFLYFLHRSRQMLSLSCWVSLFQRTETSLSSWLLLPSENWNQFLSLPSWYLQPLLRTQPGQEVSAVPCR